MAFICKFKKISKIILLAVLFSLFIVPFIQYKVFAKENKKLAVLVVIDKVGLNDLNEGNKPTFKRLLEKGAVGLMNTNTAGDVTPESAYLTIGSGNRLNAPFGDLAFNPDEVFGGSTAGEIYKRRSGINAPDKGVINIGLGSIIDANKSLNYKNQPGFLGKALHEKGLKTAVLGNADTDIEEKRQIANIAMDDTGLVDYGDVSSHILLKDPDSLMGKRTDYNKLQQEFLNLKKKTDFIAIDLGDTARVEAASNYALKSIIDYEKKKSIARADKFLAEIVGNMDLNKDLLIIVTPTPSIEAIKAKNTLTPLIIVGPGIKKGIATSSTTKRPGIIANTDIAATLLDYYDISQPAFITGQKITSQSKNDAVEFLLNLDNQIVHTSNIRQFLLSTYRNIVIIFIILSFVALTYEYKRVKPLKVMLLAILATPLAFLLLPLLPSFNIAISFVETVAVITLIILIVKTLGKSSTTNSVLLISFFTAVMIEIDVLLGSPLMKASVLGYDPMSGARFYGIGNEFMGVLIGSLLIAVSAIIAKIRVNKIISIIIGFLFLFTIYLLAAPNLGTNAGGTIAAVAGLGVTFLLWNNVKINKRNAVLALAGIFIVTALFIGFDLINPNNDQSHISRTLSLVKESGYSEIVNIVVRKESVNINLITRTQWSWMYFINLAVILIILYKEQYSFMVKRYPLIYKGILGLIVGSITALIFNDSGIVAAATMIPYASVPILLIAMDERI